MNALRTMRIFLIAVAAISLVECSGSGGSHSLPTANTAAGKRSSHSMSYGTISGSGEYPDGSVAVFDGERNAKIYFFEGPITGSSTSTATITVPGPAEFPHGSMAFDPSGDLWVTVYGNNNAVPTIYEFAAPLTTGETPSISIGGSNTGLVGPDAISYNTTTGNIYVADANNAAIDVWSSSANGNVAPSATISGSNTTIATAFDVETDAHYIYASGSSNGLAIFNLTDSGNVAPTSSISTGGGVDRFDFDAVQNVYVADGSNEVAYVPYNNYEYSHTQSTTNGLSGIAVDDGGFVYGVAGNANLYVYDPISWAASNGSTATIIETVSPGSGAELTSLALYSIGKFNGTEPQ